MQQNQLVLTFGDLVIGLDTGQARFGEARVDRVILLGSGLLAPTDIAISPSLVFRAETTAEVRPEDRWRRSRHVCSVAFE